MALLDLQTHFIYLVRVELTPEAPAADWNRWIDEKHVPDLLTVPGFASATRYQELGAPNRYLAAYEIESPKVFDAPRYREVTGWGGWEPHVHEWRRGIFEHVEP